jgi:nucleoside-diphosphate-sugar epimerase
LGTYPHAELSASDAGVGSPDGQMGDSEVGHLTLGAELVAMPDSKLTVAVTGPTGTFGFGLMPLLQDDERIARIVGIARRPFDASERGWTKLTYRQGDVRDRAALEEAFQGADVVVHLAFMITGAASRETIRQINIEGTLNTFRAAAEAGAQRFVYASSVAAYGFHRDNPVGMTEDWPARPAAHLFYAQEKAEIERLLHEEAAAHPGIGVYLLRPPIVLGPHVVGAKDVVPGAFAPILRRLSGLRGRIPLPVITPPVPMQFIHEVDVGQAFLLCIVGAGAPGVYNITGDGVLSGAQVLRELGLTPIPAPAGLLRAAGRGVAALPFAPAFAGWAESMSHPAIMEASKAKQQLGWRPRYSTLEALRDTLNSR